MPDWSDEDDESSAPPGLGRGALIASVAWVVLVLVQAWLFPPAGGAGVASTLALLILPLAILWGLVIGLRALTQLRAEAADLRAAVEAMREAYDQAPRVPVTAPDPLRAEPPQAPAPVAPPEPAEVVPTPFLSRRDATLTVASADRRAAHAVPAAPQPDVEEPALALGTPAEPQRPPMPMADLIRALQFPENAEDREGFRALRMALEDHRLAKLIRAAQDVLTLLSQEGIYMDDLKPEMARPDLWRRFAAGERGRSVAAIGGIRDRASLALTAGRMREDTVFRDAAHHFLRSFDRTFVLVEPNATDAEIAALSDTRTARAFMLFGRVTGTFD